MAYNLATIRDLVQNAFTDKELRRFCQDHPTFKPLLVQFSSEASLADMTDILLEYCGKHVLLSELLSRIEEFNLRQFARYRDRLYLDKAPGPAAVDRHSPGLPQKPPHFIERKEVLAAYQRELRQDRLVIIKGMAGVGKTALGAALARLEAERGEQIFWFSFDPVTHNTAEALFWALAAFLENDGKPDLLRYLKGEISAGKPLRADAKLSLLLASLTSGNYLLCFDDFQEVKDAEDVLHFFSLIQRRFRGRPQALPVRFIIMGREIPPTMEYLVAAPLTGFTYEEAVVFVEGQGIALPPVLVEQLWERTEGNPALLHLAASKLAGMGGDREEVEQFIADMARREGDIRDYLVNEIYDTLSSEQQQVAGMLSIFPTAVHRGEVEELLYDQGLTGVVSHVDALIYGSLLHETSDGEIVWHSLVRDCCYRMLDPGDRRRFHQIAADYYKETGNYLAAAYHSFPPGRAGHGRAAQEQALELLTSHATAIIQRGEARGLLEQLARFQRSQLGLKQWVTLCQVKGNAHKIQGEYESALAAYETALPQAMEEGTRAELLCQIGTIHHQLGDYRLAMERFAEGLEICESLGDQAGQANADHNIAWVHYRLGQLAEARERFVACREAASELDDAILVAKADLGLGTLDWREGQLEAARKKLESSRRTFCAFQDRRGESTAVGNLGLIYRQMGDPDRELACYRQAMQIQEEMGDVYNLYMAYNNLGDFYGRLQDYEQMARHYEKLARLARDTEHKPMLSTAFAGLADASLAMGDPQQALNYAQDAEQMAQDIGSSVDLGVSYRVQGQAWLALGEVKQAQTCFERSIPLLEEAREEEELAKAERWLEQARSRGT
jgi:tetratricopeptide (TPR) repeat protein